MAVLVTAEVHGQTQQGYDGMFALLADGLKQAPGFLAHTAHPVEGGWRVIEMWASITDANQFFAKHVAPNLTPGVRPKRSVQELHSFLAP